MNALNLILGSLARFARREDGASGTEYALLLALLGGAAALAKKLLE